MFLKKFCYKYRWICIGRSCPGFLSGRCSGPWGGLGKLEVYFISPALGVSPWPEHLVSTEYSSSLGLGNPGGRSSFHIPLGSLGQGSANYSLKGQSYWSFAFVLGHSHTHLLHIVCGCFWFTTAELSNRDRFAFKATHIFYLALYRRLSPALL